MAKSALRPVAPSAVNRTVAPTRRPNVERRTREHLAPGDVETLMQAAKAQSMGAPGRHHDSAAFRHGLRAAELCDLRWDQVEFQGRGTALCGGSRMAP